MTKILAMILALAPAAALAEAQIPAQRSTNWQFALRSSYAAPFGSATGAAGDDLSQSLSGAVPVALEINYRLTPEVYLGAFGRYGFGSLGAPIAAACAGASCSASTLEIGMAAYYHFKSREKWDPWLGFGMAYEQLTMSGNGPGGSADLTIRGLQFLDLQFGVDYQASPLFAIGPFISMALGEYTSADVNGTSGSIDSKAIHGFFNVGVKLSLNP